MGTGCAQFSSVTDKRSLLWRGVPSCLACNAVRTWSLIVASDKA